MLATAVPKMPSMQEAMIEKTSSLFIVGTREKNLLMQELLCRAP